MIDILGTWGTKVGVLSRVRYVEFVFFEVF